MAKRKGIMAGMLVCSSDKVLRDYALIYEDDIIVDIVPNSKVRGDSWIIDARDCIVCPGFVNAHNHMYGVISHGTPLHCNARTLKPRLEQYWWPQVEDRITPDLVKLTTRYACVDMTRNGITCFDDTLEAPFAIPGALAQEADIVEACGLRGVLGFEATQRISIQNGLAGLQENRDFIIRQRERGAKLVRGIMCAHTTFTCDTDFLRTAYKMAVELDDSLQIHLCESVDEGRYCLEKYGKFAAEVYNELGILSERLLASQCVVMDPSELDMMGRENIRVSHQPISNANSGNGIAPVREMLDHGINVGLGTDGEVGSMMEIMRTTYYIHKARRMTSVDVITMPEIFRMATFMGAKAVGIQDVGALKAGMQADYLAISMDAPTPFNEGNSISQLIMYRNSSDISRVVVAGETLMENKKLLTLDEERIKADMREATDEYWRTING